MSRRRIHQKTAFPREPIHLRSSPAASRDSNGGVPDEVQPGFRTQSPLHSIADGRLEPRFEYAFGPSGVHTSLNDLLQAHCTGRGPQEQQRQEVSRYDPVSSIPGTGTPLPDGARVKMENAFQYDFTKVKIHSNSHYPKQLGALALTSGDAIHFAPDSYHPNSRQGQELIAHELAHVVQQKSGRVSPTARLNGAAINDNPTLEAEANRAGRSASADQSVQMVGDGRDLGATSSAVQRLADPEIHALLVGHASPRWEHARGAAPEELNLNLSTDRVHEVEIHFRELFNRAYGDVGTPAYAFDRSNVDVEEAIDLVSTYAAGSSETIKEAGQTLNANDPEMRRVDMTTRVISHIQGSAPYSVAKEERMKEDDRSNLWAVRILLSGSAGISGASAGAALGELKNRRTGQKLNGVFIGRGWGGSRGLPIPSASLDPSWSDFTTEEPLTFGSFIWRQARLTDFSAGMGPFGYSFDAKFWIDGMREPFVDVSGPLGNKWDIGGSDLRGRWLSTRGPGPRTIIDRSIATEYEPYELWVSDEFVHVAYFDTASSQLDDANLDQLEVYVATIIAHIQAHEEQYRIQCKS